ncbi:MAG TPA: SH3 domain-containing protein [Vicinamibacterales bacterium]|nr:SH3 domain-containing protein [Vicinamibacterales bacterium]
MLRRTAAVIGFLVLAQSPLLAQAPSAQFTVNVEAAAIRTSPSVASPIIGHASRGAVLEVTRDIGAWVKVAWPDAADGVGYVHQSMGKLSRRATVDERLTAAFPPATDPAPAAAPAAQDTTIVHTTPPAVPLSSRTTYVAPPSHFIGLGGRLGTSMQTTGDSRLEGFGITSRIWSRGRLGVQLDATRSTMKSEVSPSRVTAMQFTPSVIYSLRDRLTDYVWLRPYFGGGGAFTHSTLKGTTPDDLTSVSDNSLGVRAFGGAEVTFSAVPRFAVSADLGYLWSQQSFEGFALDGLGFALSAHWYVK